MAKKPAKKAPKAIAAERRGHDNQLSWDEERVGRLYQLYLNHESPNARAICQQWNEKYPTEAVDATMVHKIAQKHEFHAHLFLDRPDHLNPYLQAQGRIRAMAHVVKREAPNASVDFIKGLQGAIFSKLLLELENITIDTPEKADQMLAITERLLRIEHQKRGVDVDDRPKETAAIDLSRQSWREVLDEARSKH